MLLRQADQNQQIKNRDHADRPGGGCDRINLQGDVMNTDAIGSAYISIANGLPAIMYWLNPDILMHKS